METNEVVSIIIPIYNVEAYLRQCLETVIHQTYPHLEIILVNDGSPDQSEEICKEFLGGCAHPLRSSRKWGFICCSEYRD